MGTGKRSEEFIINILTSGTIGSGYAIKVIPNGTPMPTKDGIVIMNDNTTFLKDGVMYISEHAFNLLQAT